MSIKLNVKEISEKKADTIINNGASKSKRIMELFNNGIDIKRISELMEIRYNFAYNVISNAILRGEIDEANIVRTQESSKKQIILDMHNAGKTLKDICMELKINYNYAWKVVKEASK